MKNLLKKHDILEIRKSGKHEITFFLNVKFFKRLRNKLKNPKIEHFLKCCKYETLKKYTNVLEMLLAHFRNSKIIGKLNIIRKASFRF